jgi:hypothetical protein
MAKPVIRICHDFQIQAFRNRDETDDRLKGGSETYAFPHLRGRKCTVFTENTALAGLFRDRLEKGGGVIAIDLDTVPDGDKGFWEKTGDWHVSWGAVFAHGRELTPEETAALMA